MFIQTEATSNPATLKFLPGDTVMPDGSAAFANADNAKQSPLAKRLFEIDGVVVSTKQVQKGGIIITVMTALQTFGGMRMVQVRTIP